MSHPHDSDLRTKELVRGERESARERGRDNVMFERRKFSSEDAFAGKNGFSGSDSISEICRKLRVSQFKDPTHLLALKELLSSEEAADSANAFFLQEGALPGLVSVLTSGHDDAKSQLLAAQCVTNLAPLNEKNGVNLARSMGPYLVTNLSHASPLMCEASGVALGNLALAGPRVVRVLLNQEAVTSLIAKLKENNAQTNENVQSAVFYALYHILHANNGDLEAESQLLLLEECQRLISRKCPLELHWVLFLLSCNPELHKRLTSPELITKCLDVCTYEIFQKSDSRPLVKVVTPIVRFLANICAGFHSESAALQVLRYPDLVAILMALLATNYTHLCKETIWFFSNIVNNDSVVVQEELIDLDFMDKLEFHTSQAIQKIDPYLQA